MAITYNPRTVTDGLVLALDAGNPKSYDGSNIDENLYIISGGGFHAAAIKTDGTLWTWGLGTDGQFGNADTTNRSTPITTFTGGTNWKQISAGYYYTSAIKTDGTLWTWGNNNRGQLGINAIIFRSTPVTTFAGGTNWRQVSSGNPTAAIKTDGTLWMWGFGGQGQVGNATISDALTPITTFAGGTNWKQVSASNSIAAIKTDGTLWTWGNGNFGHLGNASTTINNSTPVTTFLGGTNWKQVSAGSQHVAAIKTDGTLWTWGRGTLGRLGNATTAFVISTPVTTFAGGTNWKQVSCGGYHTTAIKTDGTLWVWGSNGFVSNGQLGNASIVNISTPVTTFAGGTDWKEVSAGYDFTLASKTDGTLWAWGNGNFGKLGNGGTLSTNSTPITTFSGGTNWNTPSALGTNWTISGTNWNDLSGRGNNLNLFGGVSFSNGVLDFNGVDGYAQTTANVIGTGANIPHTMEMWVNFDTIVSARWWLAVLGQYSTGAHHWIGTSATTTQFGTWGSTQTTPNLLGTSTWLHIVNTFDGTNLINYVNTTASSPLTATGFNFSNSNFSIGLRQTGENYFDGKVAIARIYNRALTASEIQQNFNALRGRFGI